MGSWAFRRVGFLVHHPLGLGFLVLLTYIIISPGSCKKGFLVLPILPPSISTPPVNVKTVIKGKGDPGYLLLTASEHFQLRRFPLVI
jgi:hypothetical protein